MARGYGSGARGLTPGQFHHSNAVSPLGGQAGAKAADQGVLTQLAADRQAQGTAALAVDDAGAEEARGIGAIEQVFQAGQRLLYGEAVKVYLRC